MSDAAPMTQTELDLVRMHAGSGDYLTPDREEAWAEILREREIDRVAAEHAARQLDMFGGGS